MNPGETALACGELPQPASSPRSPLQRMLHALKQPVTGLHCSLELALAGPRTAEQQVRTLREGLELAERMSVLVAAIGELVEGEEEPRRERAHAEAIALRDVLRETIEELRPVAETNSTPLELQVYGPLPVWASRPRLATAVFRLLDSVLSLSRPANPLRVHGLVESGEVSLEISWLAAELDPFSRPELGLLLAEAAWRRLGARWTRHHGAQNVAQNVAQNAVPNAVENVVESVGKNKDRAFRRHAIAVRLPLAEAGACDAGGEPGLRETLVRGDLP